MKQHKVFKDLLPPLSDDEYAELERQCVADKRIHVAPVIWKDWLVDGYNRAAIAKKHTLDMPGPRVLDPSWTEDQVIEWVYRNQVGRRNLNAAQMSHFRACLYEAKKAKKPEKSPRGQFEPTGGRASEEVAAETGVSPATVKRDAARKTILDALPKTVQQRARSGQEKLTDAQVKQLAATDAGQMQQVDRTVRVGQAPDVKTAYKQVTGKALTGSKTPKKKTPAKPPKKLDRNSYYKQWDSAIGPLVRLVDKIANGVGESRNGHHKKVQTHLNNATTAMQSWLGVKK